MAKHDSDELADLIDEKRGETKVLEKIRDKAEHLEENGFAEVSIYQADGTNVSVFINCDEVLGSVRDLINMEKVDVYKINYDTDTDKHTIKLQTQF